MTNSKGRRDSERETEVIRIKGHSDDPAISLVSLLHVDHSHGLYPIRHLSFSAPLVRARSVDRINSVPMSEYLRGTSSIVDALAHSSDTHKSAVNT